MARKPKRKTSAMNAESHTRPRTDAGPLPVLLEFREVLERTRLSKTTLSRMERAGRFPTRLHLSERKVAWVADEIDEWLQARSAHRNKPPGQA